MIIFFKRLAEQAEGSPVCLSDALENPPGTWMKALVYGHHFQMHFAISNVFLGSEVLYEVLLLWVIPAVCNWWISDFSRKGWSLLISNIKRYVEHSIYNIDD